MSKNALLVGLTYTGPELPDVKIDVLGLCRPRVAPDRAAFALYEYDVVVINPASYSHFLFGRPTAHSGSEKELWDLKAEDNNYDLDSAFDSQDRTRELDAAIAQGTTVVWLLARQKHTKFFGLRSIYMGYANEEAEGILASGTLHEKKSRRLTIDESAGAFGEYFEGMKTDGWTFALSERRATVQSFAQSPEGYLLGGRVKLGESIAWLLTPPTTQDQANTLVRCALRVGTADLLRPDFEGIFLSHTKADKPFVRQLKDKLHARGVKDVWLDEAEILVGDSLTKKIDEGLRKTKYIGVVLSPRSVTSAWVERELEVAINREIATGEVVVLPILYEQCELPAFLRGKLYADFTTPESYDESLDKLLRRLRVQSET